MHTTTTSAVHSISMARHSLTHTFTDHPQCNSCYPLSQGTNKHFTSPAWELKHFAISTTPATFCYSSLQMQSQELQYTALWQGFKGITQLFKHKTKLMFGSSLSKSHLSPSCDNTAMLAIHFVCMAYCAFLSVPAKWPTLDNSFNVLQWKASTKG